MDFFNKLPEVYVGVNNQASYYEETQLTYVRVKNFFRTARIRKDYEKYVTLFEPYYIGDGMRPDNVAQEVYGDVALDWIILMTNNILDMYTQWPKQFEELRRYVSELYGEENMVATHHWETREVKDEEGDIILPGGIIIQENATFKNWKNGTTIPTAEAIASISNYEYEEHLNEKKRFIYIMTGSLVDQFARDFEELVAYQDNSEITTGNQGAPLTKIEPSGEYSVLQSGRSIYPSFGVTNNFTAAAAATKAFLESELQ